MSTDSRITMVDRLCAAKHRSGRIHFRGGLRIEQPRAAAVRTYHPSKSLRIHAGPRGHVTTKGSK